MVEPRAGRGTQTCNLETPHSLGVTTTSHSGMFLPCPTKDSGWGQTGPRTWSPRTPPP